MVKARKPFKVDLVLREEHQGYDTIHKCPSVLGMKDIQTLEKSGAASGSNTAISQAQKDALAAKKKAKAMSIAVKPGQQIAMNAFMMYMSGKTLNIFSISITAQAILNPIGNLVGLERTFASLEGVDLQLAKLAFVALNLVWLGIGLYKMASMRLLPTTSADWTGQIVWKEMMEASSIPPQAW
eukprot:CAMPEP_0194030116 /NCGR_PEP_ID=MMETSP0009_2-20130614/3703_1 /TAXON_ID=210454 /ORGANISM="Grammatophora oceanica, Strain CCMP 410" /LENGTH=182 /DNA_ID=CAMNT_0038670001 /DNA_START=87 /DNA_END=632 /DNA_ORIENTATION=+